MSVFNVDYNELVVQMLPVSKRKPKRIGWLRALVAPVVELWNLFMMNRAVNLYNLAHNSQVCYMQAALNDTFDKVMRRIRIVDAVYIDPVYIYTVPELKPVTLYNEGEAPTLANPHPDPIPLYKDSELSAGVGGFSFIVRVPVVVVFNMARLRALVDSLRLPGRQYNVVTF